MPAWRWLRFADGVSLRRFGPWLLVLLALLTVRFSKGALFADAYAFLSRPFWPGTAQAECPEQQPGQQQLTLQREVLR
jgi:rod shape-determining protein MreC